LCFGACSLGLSNPSWVNLRLWRRVSKFVP
jgi:hypothetical protein